MIKETCAEQKIKDAIQKLKEASFCIEDARLESLQEHVQLTDGEWVMLGEVKADVIGCAIQLKELIGE